MSTKSKTQTASKAKKTDSAGAQPAAAKTETPKSETADSTSETASESSGGGKKSSAPSREISYFSSVSNDDYRAGWNDIFSAGEGKPARKPVKRAAAKAKNGARLPATITLEPDDLDPATREKLEDLFRRQARKKRLNYAKLSRDGQVSWQLSCHISGV
jgi:hypothetical protein